MQHWARRLSGLATPLRLYAHMPLARTLSALDACNDRNFLSAARCPLHCNYCCWCPCCNCCNMLRVPFGASVCLARHTHFMAQLRFWRLPRDSGKLLRLATHTHTHALETQLQVGKCVNWVIAAPVKLWLSAFKACSLPLPLPYQLPRCVRCRTWLPRSVFCIHGNFLAAVAKQRCVSLGGVVFDCCRC